MVDPFNGGSSATMFIAVGTDAVRERARVEVERRRALVNTASIARRLGASPGELREVLEALGLIEPPGAVRESPATPTQGHPEPTVGPSTGRTDPKSAPSMGTSTAVSRRIRRSNPNLCAQQLHPWIRENIRERPGRADQCKLCQNEARRARRQRVRAANRPHEVAGQRMCGTGEHLLPWGSGECKPCRKRRDKQAREKRRTPNAPRMCRSKRHVIPVEDVVCKVCRAETQREYRAQVKASRPVRPPKKAVLSAAAKERRKRNALVRARAVVAALTVETAPVDGSGVEVLLCASRLHRKPGPGGCLLCVKLRRARMDVARFERELAQFEVAA
jgi:hypothetical protein